MVDTGFRVEATRAHRLAALYSPDPATGRATRNDALGRTILEPPDALLGGGGLASSAADYGRFAAMLLNGGERDGVRLLSPRTLRFMAANHLPGGGDLDEVGRPLFAETTFDGVGFGLGFAVVLDPVRGKVPSSPGELSWGGAASTFFFVDAAEHLTALLFTQLLPSSTYPLRSQLRQLVYQALID
jgi:CubicO group peptidase (beta-lactamase class C family)